MLHQRFYGVYLGTSEQPLALFLRENWAIDWQKKMAGYNVDGNLFVREYHSYWTIFTKIYSLVNLLKVALTFSDYMGAWDAVNKLTDFLISVDFEKRNCICPRDTQGKIQSRSDECIVHLGEAVEVCAECGEPVHKEGER